MIDKELNDIVRRLETVEWNKTMNDDLQWYYAEEGLYVIKLFVWPDDRRFILVRANNYLEAISKAQIIYGHSDDSRENKDLLCEIKRLNATIDELKCKNIEMFQLIRNVYRAMKDGYDGYGYKILSDYFNKLIQKP